MASTYTLIASNTVGSGGVATVTFSSIPATYTDLLVKGSVRCSVSANYEDLYLQFNASGITRRMRVGGNGTVAFSDVYSNNTPGIAVGASASANIFSNFDLYIPNYAGSAYKSMNYDTVTENNATAAVAQMVTATWDSSSAITSITFNIPTHTLLQYSSFYLYGIKNS
jgi:hypothetical protein